MTFHRLKEKRKKACGTLEAPAGVEPEKTSLAL
jgi:hypothetical protein